MIKIISLFFVLFLSAQIYPVDDKKLSNDNSKLKIEEPSHIDNNQEKEFKVESLTSPLQIWQADLPNKDFGSIRITISFFGTKFYQKDLDSKKYLRYEGFESVLTGFVTVSTIGNKLVPPDCPFPDVNITPIQGVKTADGTIRLFSYVTAPIFSGSFNFFKGATTDEIYDIKGNEGKYITAEMRFDHHTRPFSGNRTEPIKITRIK